MAKPKFIIPAAILIIIAVSAAIFILQKELRSNKNIKVSGNIEGDDVRISFRVEGQIIELLADEGTEVPVAVLEDYFEFTSRLGVSTWRSPAAGA